MILAGLLAATMLSAEAHLAIASPPEVISPDECTVEPLTQDELVDVASASPAPSVEADDQPLTGVQADLQTIEQVTAIVRESVACANANDPLRAYALFTPRYLRERFGGDNADDLGHLIAALSRDPAVPAPDDRLALVSITNVRILEKGSVAATVETENAAERFVDDIILIRLGERWWIDRAVLGSTSGVGTPAS